MMKRLACVLVFALVACTPTGGSFSANRYAHAARTRVGSTPIQHIVVIMQENRSFDNLFHGFPGANTVTQGKAHGKYVSLKQVPLAWKWDLRHDHPQFLEDYDGGLGDGFDDQIKGFTTGPACGDPINHPKCWTFWTTKVLQSMAYSYVDPTIIQPYWTMASEYTLGDNTFASNNGPSFPSHQFLIAAQAGHAVEVPTGQPWGCDAPSSVTVEQLAFGPANPPAFPAATGHEVPGPYPCFAYPTIATLLDGAGITWRYYASGRKELGSYLLSAFDAIQAVREGPDWQNVVSPDSAILSDIANGQLPQVSWVTPTAIKSDHCGPGSGAQGPAWVASIVNAIGESPYWNNTAIVIMWDEWGGWYDHVVPPQLSDPVTKAYEGLGFRIPLIVVSPYAKTGYVSHKLHEVASSLHFIETTFGLGSLGLADARADAYDDIFDFNQPPTPFQPIPTALDAHYFLTHASSGPGDTE